MNIKSLFMLGMLSIPTGICGDIPENHMIGSNNSIASASNNLLETHQVGHVSNANSAQVNNSEQQHAVLPLPNLMAPPQANHAQQNLWLQYIMQTLQQVIHSPNATEHLLEVVGFFQLMQDILDEELQHYEQD